jgi:hypothetical protein
MWARVAARHRGDEAIAGLSPEARSYIANTGTAFCVLALAEAGEKVGK